MAYIKVENTFVIGVSPIDTGGYIEVPITASEIEALLSDQSKIIRYINGDLRVENNTRYWQLKFEDEVRSLTRPSVLNLDYGEKISIEVADLPIIVAFAGCDTARTHAFTDTQNNLHVLTTYEWKHVVELACDVLSQLSQIRHTITVLTADSEERYNSVRNTLRHKVNAAYGRP